MGDSNKTSGARDEPGRASADVKEALAGRDRIYQIRGRIISETNDLESSMDAMLCWYFDQVRRPTLDEFRSALLSSIGFGAKIDIVRRITNQLGVKDRVAGTLARLEKAVDMRNHVAHSHITINIEARDINVMRDVLQWRSERWSRRGRDWQEVDERELAAQADFVSGLGTEMGRLVMGFVARNVGQDIGAALDDFDRLNPDLVKPQKHD